MKRRQFLKRSIVTAGTAALGLRSGEAAPPEDRRKDRRCNLLVIHTDQQSCWTIGAYGGGLVSTPHIDSLARQGSILTNFFTNSAVCTPSRGCLVTGRYPHSHGAYRNNIELNRDEQTIARVLKQAGYDTGYAGKWHLDGTPKPGWMRPQRSMGFDDCRHMFNRGHWKTILEDPDGTAKVLPYGRIGDENTFTTDWLASRTIEFIREPRNKPFFFMVSIPDPHPPFTVRTPYDTMFKPADMPVPVSFDQADLPAWARAGGKRKRPGTRPAAQTRRQREARLRASKARYCGQVKCIDDSVGRILKCLKDRGALDETIVVFTTDHGEYMGEHGLMGKNNLYETAYRIPMLIRWPKRIPGGTAIGNVVSTVDFQPTILALMGIKPSGREQGRDASGLLTGKTIDWTDESFLHHSSLARAGIFTPRYELAFVQGGDHILFDRLNDPHQMNNLYGDPRYTKVVKDLHDRILAHNIAVKAPAAAWLKTV